MGVIQHKIWHDLWYHKARTFQVVLIIAIGAAAIGVIVGARTLVIAGMTRLWQESSPAMITMWANPAVDDDVLNSLAKVEGLVGVEGYNYVDIAWRRSPEDRWRPAALIARDDYAEQSFTKLDLLSGSWPQSKTFAIGQGAGAVFGVDEGAQIHIRINDDEEVVAIGGVVYDPIAQPPSFGGNVQFFTTRERLGELTGDQNFNRILARAPAFNQQAVTQTANAIKEKLEKQGVETGGFLPPFGSRIADPEQHFFQAIMDGVFLILGIMALLSLFLGLFLVYNTIEAILSRQINQIGIMKAIGAKSSQIFLIYLGNIFAYSFFALLIAVPIGIIGSWGLSVFLLNNFNADPGSFRIAWLAIGAQVAIALLAPLLASLIPILSGVRISVREAINTYGLQAAPGILGRLLVKATFLPRLVVLAISNTFRHKGRVIRTQITLVFSGIIFIVVMSVRDSTIYTFSDVLRTVNQYNVFLIFQNPQRISRLESLAYPDVRQTEMWYRGSGRIRLKDSATSADEPAVSITGLPSDTQLYVPQMRHGRWLLPDDRQAIVLNERVAQAAGIEVGQWVTIDHGIEGETAWQVVGLLFDPNSITSAHVPRDTLLRELGSVDRVDRIYIQTISGTANEAASEQNLRDYYEQLGVELSPGGGTLSEIADDVMGQFAIIVNLMAIMAILIGLVGSVALSGVLSLNVIDRQREIGVMRAIGASSVDVSLLFIGEGVILGWLSWLIALPFTLPLSQLMTQGLGAAVQVSIVHRYTLTGAVAWLGIITILSIAASFFPARRAMQTSVRESIAYQ